jgi:hypothetical protein
MQLLVKSWADGSSDLPLRLFLSTDDKHTVHVSVQTPEGIATLTPVAKALYKHGLAEFGSKAQMWEAAIKGKSNGQANGRSNGNGASKGRAQGSQHSESVAQV